MLKFKWNALRTGDPVLLHDPRSMGQPLLRGHVAFIEVHKTANGANGLGISVTAAGGGSRVVLWPSYMVVHADPRDRSEPCWRCNAFEELAQHDAAATLLRYVPVGAENGIHR